MRNRFLALVLCLTACLFARAEERPPNFIVIFCDDLGYADLGCFGSEKIKTPHLDRMAAEGMRLTSFYSTCSVCSPSRSSLLTGCYPRRVNMHVNDRNLCVLFPADKKGLNPEEITIAETLKAKDYATICVGKWHVGDHPDFLPHKQGFDSYYGIPYSNDMNRREVPLPLLRNERVIEAPVDQTTITPRYTKEVVQFIHRNKDKPFFIYLPHTFPHVPLFASERFKGKSARGRYGATIEEIDWSTGEGSQRCGCGRKHLGFVHIGQRLATKGKQWSPARSERPNLGRRTTSTLRCQVARKDSQSLGKFRNRFHPGPPSDLRNAGRSPFAEKADRRT